MVLLVIMVLLPGILFHMNYSLLLNSKLKTYLFLKPFSLVSLFLFVLGISIIIISSFFKNNDSVTFFF